MLQLQVKRQALFRRLWNSSSLFERRTTALLVDAELGIPVRPLDEALDRSEQVVEIFPTRQFDSYAIAHKRGGYRNIAEDAVPGAHPEERNPGRIGCRAQYEHRNEALSLRLGTDAAQRDTELPSHILPRGAGVYVSPRKCVNGNVCLLSVEWVRRLFART